MLGLSYREKRKKFTYFVDILAVFAQITGLIVWPLLNSKTELWLIPIAVALTSFRWWENYVTAKSSFKIIKKLSMLKENLTESRYSMYLYIASWKIILFLCIGILTSEINPIHFFSKFIEGWSIHSIEIIEVNITIYIS